MLCFENLRKCIIILAEITREECLCFVRILACFDWGVLPTRA